MHFKAQERRRFLKSDTAIERLLVRGDRRIFSAKSFEFKMSVEAILMHSETVFAFGIRLIVQAFHAAVFSNIMCFERRH